jgi:D-alanine-D-alanine ligase
MKKTLEEASLDIWYALESKDFARIDFRMNKEGKLFFLEINPLPGMDFDIEENDLSFYPYMAMKSGYSYDVLVHRILESACSRYRMKL